MIFFSSLRLILRLIKSSTSTELKSFYSTIYKIDEVVTWVSAAAFCKARQKIKYHLFVDLYKLIVKFFYDKKSVQKWFDFRLLSVDGSEMSLPSSKEPYR